MLGGANRKKLAPDPRRTGAMEVTSICRMESPQEGVHTRRVMHTLLMLAIYLLNCNTPLAYK